MRAGQWLAAHRPRSRYARLRDELDALDRGVIETGLIAARATESAEVAEIRAGILDRRIDAIYTCMARTCEAAGIPYKDVLDPEPRNLHLVKSP